MSLMFYSEEGENQKEESIDKYEDLFDKYKSQSITLTEALTQMYTSSGVDSNKMNNLITGLIQDCKNKIESNLDKIKEKYPLISKDEAIIISSYTCEVEDNQYSPYKLLNKNLVSDDRINGLKKISKYFYILLKSLRKLKKYYPTKENKYLYRCIGVKVNYMIDPFNKKSIPYIEGNTKTFWSFTSTSTSIKTSYKFLKGNTIQSGTIFTLYGDILGYDISLFNVFNEEEILLEPERKFIVEQVYPPVNDIIHVRCNIQKTKPVLNSKTVLDKIIEKIELNNNNIDFRKIFKALRITESMVNIERIKNGGWEQNIIKLGGEDYIPPSNDWIGIGLKDKPVKISYFELKCGMINIKKIKEKSDEDKYAIAYIGIKGNIEFVYLDKYLNSENKSLFSEVKNIRYEGYKVFFYSKSFGKCGKGIIMFQNPKYAENYSSIFKINGIRIKVLLMCRVNPKRIRQPEIFKDCWILDANSQEIKPYSILIKIMPSSTFIEENNFIVTQYPIRYIFDALKSKNFSFKSHNNIKNALEEYMSNNNYNILDSYLLKKEIIDTKYSEENLKSWIFCIHNEIKHIYNVKDGTIVYKGINSKFPFEVGIGSIFYSRGFLSATYEKKIAENCATGPDATVMVITILNNGTNGFENYCCKPGWFSLSKYEKEIIFTSLCSFIVTDISHIGNKDYISVICEGFLFDKK